MNYFDVIVIGSGIAGLNFALRAAEQKKRVLVITKKSVAEASTNFAQGGIAGVLSKLDNEKKHIRDTLVAGSFHNNKRAVAYMVHHGPSAIARLVSLGVPFATEDGKLLLTREGGHTERRIAFVSDFTGQAIEKVLVSKVRKNTFITLLEHTFAADLLVKNKICYGVRILHHRRFYNVYGAIIVLATGGAGQLYENTTNPEISTGDGLAMGGRARCSFQDLEFVQFHPTALKLRGKPPFLISEAVRGEGAFLLNAEGERFMRHYHRLAELAPRDVVSRAIFEEEKKGPVFLDFRHKDPEFIKTRFPQIYQKLRSFGLDMRKQLIPISPAAHYLCGGIKVNLKGETDIKNLYAFGEVSGTGVHGANRLASNSLLEALVFSDRIIHLSRKSTPHRRGKIPSFSLPLFHHCNRNEKNTVKKLRKKLQQTMWRDVGIVRSKKSLERALVHSEEIETMLNKFRSNEKEVLELKNMVTAAMLITKAALTRRKSLGCHCRNDETTLLLLRVSWPDPPKLISPPSPEYFRQ